ncbi:MAG: hypothetical protein NT039_03015 [Candidatus Berkelbacteria bacterium]|nr:hypothetical protein [Candidatus Berkelbacteria bacterium]
MARRILITIHAEARELGPTECVEDHVSYTATGYEAMNREYIPELAKGPVGSWATPYTFLWGFVRELLYQPIRRKGLEPTDHPPIWDDKDCMILVTMGR